MIAAVPGQTATRDLAGSALLRRSFRKSFPPAIRGQGAYLWDAAGNRYLDLSGSAGVNFVGHGVAEIVRAMVEQAHSLEFVHGSQFTTPVAEQYAVELLSFAGENFRGGAFYFCSGGSEAVETALKLARQYQVEIGEGRRSEIISRKQSYHGATLVGVAVSGDKRRREIYRPMVREFSSVDAPYCYRCRFEHDSSCLPCGQQYAAEVERAIERSSGRAAALLLEPVSGATLGAVVPPEGYLKNIQDICRRHRVLLIADEVMTGMGRTGKNFAVDHSGIAPDMVVAAKGLSSGYAPLGAVVISKAVVEAISFGSGAFIHGFTYSSHPISLAAGRAVLNRLQRHDLVTAANSDGRDTIASLLKTDLRRLWSLDAVGDVRGLGLLWAVEFVADRQTKAPFPPESNFSGWVAQAALERGLLVYPVQGCVDGDSGDHILIAPPAVVTADQLSWAVDQLAAAIEETTARLGHCRAIA
jgi:adenosylmethionine-8-amino-7-oxononanoate aminotransferase